MNRVVLNNADHAALTVRHRFGADFGDAVNLAPVFPAEFAEAAREYPIFLDREKDGAWRAVALLGLDRDENLFLDEPHGRWDARHVPHAHARGPFLIGFQGGAGDGGGAEARTPVILVDLDDARVSADGVSGEGAGGARVFRDRGGNAPYLDAVADVLRALHLGVQHAPALYSAWDAHGLIEPVRLEVKLEGGTTYVIPDLHTVSTERLDALDDAGLGVLNRAGALAPAFLLAASAGNVQRLIERRALRDGGVVGAGSPPA